MSSPRDPHDPRHEEDRQDNLNLMALGEAVDADFTQHQAGCIRCREELQALTTTVHLARTRSRYIADAYPSGSVWNAISEAALGKHESEPGRRLVTRERVRRFVPRERARLLVALAAALIIGVGGFALGRQSSSSSHRIAARAVLLAQPGGPSAVSGTAQVIHDGSGYALSVITHSLPLRNGYYAVWVYNPAIDHMIDVGALDADGSGRFILPPGADLRDYNIVDVSAQNFDGNPAHRQSVLRGPLTK